MRRRDRGAALIVAMVAVLAIAGMAAALIRIASIRSRGTNDRLEQFRSFQAAQAAVERALARMADPAVGPASAGFGTQFLSDARVGNLTELEGGGANDATGTVAKLDGVEYFATVGDAGNGNYAIVGAARLGNVERVLEVIVKRNVSTGLPAPFPPSGAESGGAIGLYGPIGKKADLKMPGHKADGGLAEPGDELVMVSGIDRSAQGKDVLGLAVEDDEAYASVVKDVLKEMSKKKDPLPPSVFAGDPLNKFEIKDGKDTVTIETSLGQSSGGKIDGEVIASYAEAITDSVRNDLIPTGTVISGTIDTDTTLGGPDQVTVVDGKLDIDKDAVVTGSGTLVILDALDIHHADFNWDGDIIILGDTKDAKIHNHHATMDVTGTIVALGTGKGKADIHIHNDTKTDDSGTTIDGGVLLMSGTDDSGDKVNFHAHHGNFALSGLLMMMGHHVNVKLDPENGKKHSGQFSLEGNMVLAVPDSDKKNKLKLQIKGDVGVQHDSDAVDKALKLFDGFFDEYAPDVDPGTSSSYSVVVWREK